MNVNLAIRLLLLLIFLGFVLPKMLPGLGLDEVRKVQEMEDEFMNSHQREFDEMQAKFIAEVEKMNISDANLKKCVLNELRLHAKRGKLGPIQSARQLPEVRCDSKGVRSLRGINKLTKLRSITLRHNDILSLEPLANHPSLVAVDLYGGNKNMESLYTLETLSQLSDMVFPRLDQDRCEYAKEVVSVMEENHGKKAYSNLTTVCRTRN